MAGIYIHVPFCQSRCAYCDFYSTTLLAHREAYVDTVCRELRLRLHELQGEPIKTIYFGGGTPSTLTIEELRVILETLENLEVLGNPNNLELTLEANPDDLTEEYLSQLRSLPVNRLSIGVQSFCDDELQWLNRRHTSQEAFDVVLRAQKAGFENITIDLMFALPVQTLESLNYSISKALQLDVQHISAYSLMFEPDSKITKLMELNRLQPLDEDVAADMFELLSTPLISAGYEQYEISNYAKPSFYSRHNSGYWHGMRYLGLGPSAHSFDGEKRWSNIAHTIKYNAQFQSRDTACRVLTSVSSFV